MMKTVSFLSVVLVAGALAGLLLASGCSKSTDSRTGTVDPMTKMVANIDARVAHHDTTMHTDTTVDGRRGEMRHYVDDMEHMMGQLGDTLTDRGNCRMMMGGHMMGGMHGNGECPDDSVINTVHDEYHGHDLTMQTILDQGDAMAFVQEMDRHRHAMRQDVDSMMRRFDDEYGTSMMGGHGRRGK